MDWDTHWPEAKRQWLVLHGATGLVEDDIVYNNTRLRKVAATSDTFRPDPGNWPTILYRVQPSRRALILTHGLTDSPAFVKAIGSAFAEHGMGHTVLMPLLPGHGRTNPERAMAGCTYEEWRKVVDDTVAVAHMIADEVSIAGFSTGGALAFDKLLRDQHAITGKVYLFSAALSLRDIEKLYLGTHLAKFIEIIKSGKTDNDGLKGDPCKYSRMFNFGAEQLEKLIKELRTAGGSTNGKEDFAAFREVNRIFIAHSEADEVIDVECVRPLADRLEEAQRFIIEKQYNVKHSEVVLEVGRNYVPGCGDVVPPPKANPRFSHMVQKMLAVADEL